MQSVVVGLLIGLGCIGVLTRQVDFKQSWVVLGRLNGPLIIIPLVLFFANLLLRAWRWQRIFPSSSRPGLSECLIALGIGNMANFLLPGRAGDLARCVLLGRGSSLTQSSRVLATLAVEKILDGLALVSMVLVSVWALHPPQWVIALLRVGGLLLGSALILLVALHYQTEALLRAFRRVVRFLHGSPFDGKIEGLLASFADGLTAVNSPWQVLMLLATTAVIWMTEAGLVWGLAITLRLAIPFRMAAAAAGVLGLGLMIPAAPGGLGTYELFGTETFKLAGLAASGALALTIVIHAWVFVTNIAFGACVLALKGINMTQLKNRIAVPPSVETPLRRSA